MCKHQQTTAKMESNDSPAATPCKSTESSKPSIWAKFHSASVVTPADVMARQTDSLQLEFDHQYVALAPISRYLVPYVGGHKINPVILFLVLWHKPCCACKQHPSPVSAVFSKPATYHVQKKYAGAVKSGHCHFFDGQSVIVASLLGR